MQRCRTVSLDTWNHANCREVLRSMTSMLAGLACCQPPFPLSCLLPLRTAPRQAARLDGAVANRPYFHREFFSPLQERRGATGPRKKPAGRLGCDARSTSRSSTSKLTGEPQLLALVLCGPSTLDALAAHGTTRGSRTAESLSKVSLRCARANRSHGVAAVAPSVRRISAGSSQLDTDTKRRREKDRSKNPSGWTHVRRGRKSSGVGLGRGISRAVRSRLQRSTVSGARAKR